MSYITKPQSIEDKSFEIIQDIIDETRGGYQFIDELQEKIIKRCIHTSADFDWLDILKFSNQVTDQLISALRAGATLYTDTTMVIAGMNKLHLEALGCQYKCYVADPITKQLAIEQGITRSMAAVEQAANEPGEKIFVFGNAPTALFRLLELYQEGKVKPAVVVGVPVGFVGAAESKQALIESDLPYIAAQGRKGGSNIAAAIINAVLYHIKH